MDTNEQLTAFSADLLRAQANFANQAISHILRLYRDRTNHADYENPASVIVIGHSMGGMVARTMLTLDNHQSNSVNTIITLATPHSAPSAPLDRNVAYLYRDVNRYWKNHLFRQKDSEPNVAMISFAGGNHDRMISSHAAELHGIVPPANGFTVYTSGVANVWTAADHQAILWCNQLVQAVVDSLYNIADFRDPTRTVKVTERINILQSTLVGRPRPIVGRQLGAFDKHLR